MRKGINRFPSPIFFEKRSFASERDCVFISHSSIDKPAAREAAELILSLGVDIYFDENDDGLQQADKSGDDRKVVECIETGITNSTLLLGIITEKTKESWWVPYEIGSATGRRTPHAHLITKEVQALPSYIRASTIIESLKALKNWLPRQSETGSQIRMLEELARMTFTSKSASESCFARSHATESLSFY